MGWGESYGDGRASPRFVNDMDEDVTKQGDELGEEATGSLVVMESYDKSRQGSRMNITKAEIPSNRPRDLITTVNKSEEYRAFCHSINGTNLDHKTMTDIPSRPEQSFLLPSAGSSFLWYRSGAYRLPQISPLFPHLPSGENRLDILEFKSMQGAFQAVEGRYSSHLHPPTLLTLERISSPA